MEYRFHPIIEGLKCNEDGTDVRMGNEIVRIKDSLTGRYIHVNERRVTVLRLICECWHGMAIDRGMAARRIDENKGDHYSNVHWSNQGMTLAMAKRRDYSKAMELKISEREYREICEFRKEKGIFKELKRRGHSLKAWYNARKRYGEED